MNTLLSPESKFVNPTLWPLSRRWPVSQVDTTLEYSFKLDWNKIFRAWIHQQVSTSLVASVQQSVFLFLTASPGTHCSFIVRLSLGVLLVFTFCSCVLFCFFLCWSLSQKEENSARRSNWRKSSRSTERWACPSTSVSPWCPWECSTSLCPGN